VAANPTIHGHPAELNSAGQLITVCAECGQMRTILFLRKDRWFCTRCRAEGAAPPNLYPIA
jgi:translation initiation factor 2 beta subunit (eIF-2beta)/eIF-5